jgi:hypothetical protein
MSGKNKRPTLVNSKIIESLSSIVPVGEYRVFSDLSQLQPPTPTPEPPTDTPTPEPPTATPTPAIINPQPGITLTGNLKDSEGKDSGTINFIVSEDGKSITLVDVIVKYEGSSVLLGFDKESVK